MELIILFYSIVIPVSLVFNWKIKENKKEMMKPKCNKTHWMGYYGW